MRKRRKGKKCLMIKIGKYHLSKIKISDNKDIKKLDKRDERKRLIKKRRDK